MVGEDLHEILKALQRQQEGRFVQLEARPPRGKLGVRCSVNSIVDEVNQLFFANNSRSTRLR